MKKVIISLLSIVFIISMFTNVYAATGTISSGASADTVIKGKTFTVTIAGTADSPIDGMYSKLNYDKTVLSLESATTGENYGNNSSDGEILVTNNSSSTSPSSATLYTMTFKVLDDTSATTATISFSDSELHLNVDGSISNVTVNIASVTVTIKADDTTAGGTNTPSDDPNPSNGGDGSNSDGNNSSTDTDKKEENKNVSSNKVSNTNKNTNTTKKLPQTGVESTTLFAIIALAVVGITSFISYKKYKNI